MVKATILGSDQGQESRNFEFRWCPTCPTNVFDSGWELVRSTNVFVLKSSVKVSLKVECEAVEKKHRR